MNLTTTTKSDSVLTEKQQAFIDALLGPAEGNIAEARRLAGYHPSQDVLSSKKVQDEILDRTRTYLAHNAPRAAFRMTGVLDNPTELGNDKLLEAAKQILDRVGIAKKEQVDIANTTPNAILILPAKQKEE